MKSILPSTLRVKVHNPDECVDCQGTGQQDTECCPECDGTGRVVVSEPADSEPATFYLALAGVEILDIGGPLLPFLRGLMEAWPDLSQDIALWQVHGDAVEPDAWSDDGDPPRLVGVLRPTPTGPAVTWL